MDLIGWKTQVAERLRASTGWLRDAAPSMAYGALATCSILPLVAAVKGGDWGAYGTLAQLVGDVGVSLIAGRVEQWHQGSLDEMTADLDEVAADSEEWRTVLDTILAELETPKLAQAVLSEADWDRLARLLARDVERLGSRIEGDWVSGDKVSGDKVGGDKIEGDNVGRDKYSFGDVQGGVHVYPPMDERPAEPLSVHYFQRLRTHCHALPLTAMGGEATAAEDVTLDKVYIDLDTTTRVRLTDTEKADLQKENPSRSVREDAERVVTAREAAQQTRRLVLLGHPGGGKSTFVRQLLAERAAAWAEVAENPQRQPGLFPLLTVLRDLTPRLQELALNGLTRSQQEERLVECLLAQWQTDLQRFHGADQAATL
ncbi:MAG: hypothetical protein KDE19_17955, partial [Caldilineaceae bacterium]|nr:hypothetical protein [Caldilineaceae bacterium]